MSSDYLTSKNMTMLDRLLSEQTDHHSPRPFDAEGPAARLLVRRFLEGMRSETALRGILATHDQRQRSFMSDALARWDDEGGAIGSGARQ